MTAVHVTQRLTGGHSAPQLVGCNQSVVKLSALFDPPGGLQSHLMLRQNQAEWPGHAYCSGQQVAFVTLCLPAS